MVRSSEARHPPICRWFASQVDSAESVGGLVGVNVRVSGVAETLLINLTRWDLCVWGWIRGARVGGKPAHSRRGDIIGV